MKNHEPGLQIPWYGNSVSMSKQKFKENWYTFRGGKSYKMAFAFLLKGILYYTILYYTILYYTRLD